MAELILALDVENVEAAWKVLDQAGPELKFAKVGPRLFFQGGKDLINRLTDKGYLVFLDLKLHDIPNTVAIAIQALADVDLWALTIHTAGGRNMLRAAKEARDAAGAKLNLLGVSVLTSVDDQAWAEVVPAGGSVSEAVVARAGLCVEEKIEGLVCSPLELIKIREAVGHQIKTIVPGIRPAAGGDDQRRVATPAQAVAAGADFLVVGRPILQADDPRAAVKLITAQMNGE